MGINIADVRPMHNMVQLAFFFWQSGGTPTAQTLPLAQAVSGLLGALVGAAAAFGGILYTQHRGTKALRRWLAEAHFDLFQDVADCAGEYERKGNFGIFRDRLSAQVRQLRNGLYRDSGGGLKEEEYRRVYRSLSGVDYMIFVHDRGFARNLMVPYLNGCLTEMRRAQMLFGDHPKPRPNAELEIISGKMIQLEVTSE
jgi:hypothetical protein